MENYTQISLAEWQQWKQEIKDRLNQTVENFIAIGYRLRQIQDTEAFRNDGYASVYEFAQKEFSLSDSTTNRFMAINAKFTINGDGMELLPEFKGISYSKLQEMLTLSDEDCKLITVNTTVKEIRELKNFNHDDANKYTAHPGQQAQRSPLQECIWDFFSQVGNKGLLEETMEALASPDYGDAMAAAIADTISPAGNRTHRKGIVYLFMYDFDRGVSYKLMTSPMPVKITWRSFLEEVRTVYADYMAFEGSVWESAYGSIPESKTDQQIPGQIDIAQVADVGNENEEENQKQEPEKDKADDFATSQVKTGPKKEEKTPENVTEQSEIVSELPASVPESSESVPKQSESAQELSENVIKTECETVSEEENMAAVVETSGETITDAGAAAISGETEEMDSSMAAVIETDWEKLWDETLNNLNSLELFFDTLYDEDDLLNNRILKKDLEDRYKEALAVAATIERILNGQKYHA